MAEEGNSKTPKNNNLTMIMVVMFGVLVIVFVGVLIYQAIYQSPIQDQKQEPTLTPTPVSTPMLERTPFDVSPTAVLTPSPTPTTGDQVSGVQQLVVEAFEFAYNPGVIRVGEGQKIEVQVINTGNVQHDFVIDELNIRTKLLAPGESETVEFTIPINGMTEYTYYCSVGNHRALGMEGRIEVTR